jgi:DNA-binding NtrC family response regulator
VPSLSERLDDIPLLIQYFLKKYNEAYSKQIKGLTRKTQTILYQHDWPGNVRELENVISCACLTTVNDFIDVDDLPENLLKPPAQNGHAGDTWRPLPLEEVRREHIRRVLEACEGNRVRAAQMLGIGRTSLYRFLKRAEKKTANSAAQ